MTRDRQIFIGFVVLAGLGGAVYFRSKKDAAVGTATTQAADLPSINGTDDLDKMSITNGDKSEVVLEKKDDKWRLTKPVDALANQTNVKQTLDNLKELKATEVVAPSADDDIKKSYELDPTHAVHIVGWKGADKKVDDYFGKNGSRGEMMMVEGKPAVYSASSYATYMYNREVKGWRDTEIFKFDDANVSSIAIDNTNGTFSFTKGDKWAGTFKGKPIDRFDDTKMVGLLASYKSLNAEDFGDGKSPSDTGLDKPEANVTILLKDDAGKYTLHFGKVSTGTSRYAKKDADDTIFVVGSGASDWATNDASKFQKALDGGVADGGAKDAAAKGDSGAKVVTPKPH
jgi:hypothetical protein